MTMGEKIQEVLDWSGVKQAELARRTGISTSMISSYITGVHVVSLEAAQKIATALDVSLWVLLNGDPLPVHPLDLTPEERDMVTSYRLLTSSERDLVKHTLHTLNERKT